MSRRVRGKMGSGHDVWIVVPNIAVKKFATALVKKSFYLEIFYYFGQLQDIKGDTKTVLETKKRILVELGNRVCGLEFYSSEIVKHWRRLVRKPTTKKRMYDFRPYQVLSTLVQGYLDTLHSIADEVMKLDALLGGKSDILMEDWYKIDIDIRNIAHHNESLMVDVGNTGLYFTFERLPRRPNFFSNETRDADGRFHAILPVENLGNDVLSYLNEWARRYLERIDKSESLEVITGFYPDGRLRTTKTTLGSLLLLEKGL